MHNTEKLTVLKNPTLQEAKSIIEKVFLNRKTLVLEGNCKVIYDCIASSKLDLGERLLIVKSDGAILVHRSFGYEPVNWQPSGSILHVQMKTNTIRISAIRHSPRETLRVIFDKIFMLSALLLDDSADFTLFASEKDMHQAILIKPSLIEEGFKPISYEKKVAPGFIDTDMTKNLPEDQRSAMLSQVPLGRLGAGNDIANSVIFLASGGGDYITGETLHVNGGMVMD